MRIAKYVVALGLAGLLAGACSSKTAEQPAPAKTGERAAAPASSAGHAAPDVKPGSHEDWCEEHAVPESQCTLCNPSLVAAFKATGDWCPEHGLPESQCKKCNPDLKIERPPKTP